MEDSKTISNQYEEVQYVAARFGVMPSLVYRLKEELRTNDREEIYKALDVYVQPNLKPNINLKPVQGEAPEPKGTENDPLSGEVTPV